MKKLNELERINFVVDYLKENNINIITKDEILDLFQKEKHVERNGKIIGSTFINAEGKIERVWDSTARWTYNKYSYGPMAEKRREWSRNIFLNLNNDSTYELFDYEKNGFFKRPKYSEFISKYDSNLFNEKFLKNNVSNLKNKNKPKLENQKLKRYITNYLFKQMTFIEFDWTCVVCGDKKMTRKRSFVKNDKIGELYLEGHHILPMSYQSKVETNIDAIWNIVPLCPLHHREIHHINNEQKEKKILNLLNSYNIKRNANFLNVLNKNVFENKISNEKLLEIIIKQY